MRFTSQARVHPRSLWPNCKDPHVALLRPLALDLRWKQSLPLGWDQIPSEPKVNFQTSTPQLSVSAPFNPFSSVQFRRSVLSDSLRPHEPQHARPPWPSPTSGVYPNSCPLSWWCQSTISSSVIPFSSCPQSFPASGSFQMSHLFSSGGQNIGVSASTSVFPINTQDWSPSGWTGWISLQSKGLSTVFSNTTVQKHQFFGAQFSL